MKEIAKKYLNTSWPCRIDGRPNAHVDIKSNGELKLGFFFNPKPYSDGFSFTIDRKLARLLARRILQCLEDTK